MAQEQKQKEIQLFENLLELFEDGNEKTCILEYSRLTDEQKNDFLFYLENSTLSSSQKVQLINVVIK